MSTRRETVYWHGCRDEGCDMDSHDCVRVEVWVESPIDRGPIGYIYDEAVHCPQCARARFDEAVLDQSREIGRLESGDEWWDATTPGCQELTCDSCSAVVDESHDDQACGCKVGDFRDIRPLRIDEHDGLPLRLSA